MVKIVHQKELRFICKGYANQRNPGKS